jgi:hypothetical protein
VRVRDGVKCARDRLYNQMGVTQNASGCETLNPFLDDLSCPFLLSGSLERLHFSVRWPISQSKIWTYVHTSPSLLFLPMQEGIVENATHYLLRVSWQYKREDAVLSCLATYSRGEDTPFIFLRERLGACVIVRELESERAVLTSRYDFFSSSTLWWCVAPPEFHLARSMRITSPYSPIFASF